MARSWSVRSAAGLARSGFRASPGISSRLTEAPARRQITNVNEHGPHLVVGEDAFGSGHSGRPQAVFDHPVKLPVAVCLHASGGQRGYGWRDAVKKRYTRALAVESVTREAVVRKALAALPDAVRGDRQRIDCFLVSF